MEHTGAESNVVKPLVIYSVITVKIFTDLQTVITMSTSVSALTGHLV